MPAPFSGPGISSLAGPARPAIMTRPTWRPQPYSAGLGRIKRRTREVEDGLVLVGAHISGVRRIDLRKRRELLDHIQNAEIFDDDLDKRRASEPVRPLIEPTVDEALREWRSSP